MTKLATYQAKYGPGDGRRVYQALQLGGHFGPQMRNGWAISRTPDWWCRLAHRGWHRREDQDHQRAYCLVATPLPETDRFCCLQAWGHAGGHAIQSALIIWACDRCGRRWA